MFEFFKKIIGCPIPVPVLHPVVVEEPEPILPEPEPQIILRSYIWKELSLFHNGVRAAHIQEDMTTRPKAYGAYINSRRMGVYETVDGAKDAIVHAIVVNWKIITRDTNRYIDKKIKYVPEFLTDSIR